MNELGKFVKINENYEFEMKLEHLEFPIIDQFSMISQDMLGKIYLEQ